MTYRPLATYEPFICRELLQRHGAARMKFLRAYTDFSTQTEFIPVSERDRGIHIHNSRVYKLLKFIRDFRICRNNTL